MNKRELAPGIMVYENVIDGYESLPQDIEDAVSGKATMWLKASVKTGDDNGINTDFRDTRTIPVPFNDSLQTDFSNPYTTLTSELAKIFYLNFSEIEKDYMQHYGINFKNHHQWAILKYGVGQKFTNHIDDHEEYHRRISTVYYINDDYIGGEIVFPRFHITYKPKANEMILFPSTYTYNHSVSPVTEGTRYAVVSWIN